MFEPSPYIQNNPQLFRELAEPAQTSSNVPLFYLLSDSKRLKEDFVLGFPYIPQDIKYSYKTTPSRVLRSGARTEDLQFVGNKAETITINNVILSTRGERRTSAPLLELLTELMRGQAYPSFFYIAIGERVIYPYMLTELDIIEEGWSDTLSGEIVEGVVNMTFIRSTWGNNTPIYSLSESQTIKRNKESTGDLSPDNNTVEQEDIPKIDTKIQKARKKLDEYFV